MSCKEKANEKRRRGVAQQRKTEGEILMGSGGKKRGGFKVVRTLPCVRRRKKKAKNVGMYREILDMPVGQM